MKQHLILLFACTLIVSARAQESLKPSTACDYTALEALANRVDSVEDALKTLHPCLSYLDLNNPLTSDTAPCVLTLANAERVSKSPDIQIINLNTRITRHEAGLGDTAYCCTPRACKQLCDNATANYNPCYRDNPKQAHPPSVIDLSDQITTLKNMAQRTIALFNFTKVKTPPAVSPVVSSTTPEPTPTQPSQTIPATGDTGEQNGLSKSGTPTEIGNNN